MMQERELVKIKSDYPGHPKGYYIGFKDQMKSDDVEFVEKVKKEDEQEKVATPKKRKK